MPDRCCAHRSCWAGPGAGAVACAAMRVGLFGATGQVGGVMLRILEERAFPLDELRLFASARSAGPHAHLRGPGAHRRGRRHRRLRRARHRAVLGRRHRLAWRWPRGSPPPGPPSSTTRRRGAWTPTCPLVVPEVNAQALAVDPQGHRRQPELHDHGRHAGAQAARPRGRAAVDGGQHLPGRVRRRPGRRGRARRAGAEGGRRRRRAHPRRRRRRASRRPRSSRRRSRST